MTTTEALIPTERTDEEKVQALVLQGDLGGLSRDQRSIYIRLLCEQYQIDWKTRPFDFITAQGKTFLYANRNCFDQLRRQHKVSIKILERVQTDQVFYVRAMAELPDGRCDESLGAVGIAGLKGDNLANAMMKAETKAKRRVTQSIVAMSLPDETEMETIPEVRGELQGPRRLQASPVQGAVRTQLPEEPIVVAEVQATEAEIVTPENPVATPLPSLSRPRARATASRLPPAVAPVEVKE